MSQQSPEILRPVPRRPFDLSLTSATPPSESEPATPNNGLNQKGLSSINLNGRLGSGTETPNGSFGRTKSILNLTSSTLFGIYSPEYNDKSEDLGGTSTPLGSRSLSQANGFSNTVDQPVQPRRSKSRPPVESKNSLPLRMVGYAVRSAILFALGSAYGLLITHLHNEHRLAPLAAQGTIIEPSYETRYLLFWGISGILMGSALPWVDDMWEEYFEGEISNVVDKEYYGKEEEKDEGVASQWMPVVRSVGAFVGIAFAIRKLAWTSTLQISLTLAMVNPFLWYLIDRSMTGFVLSAVVAIFGSMGLLAIDSTLIPNPLSDNTSSNATNPVGYLAEAYRNGKVDSAIWVMSVLFCAVLCFGHIGRRLALLRRRAREKSE